MSTRPDDVATGRTAHFGVTAGATRRRCAPGPLLFAAGGVAHRFETFSDDFGARVVHYGPESGEHD
jgi:hypothetical protein